MSQYEAHSPVDFAQAEPRTVFWPMVIIVFGFALTLAWTFELLWATGSLVWAMF